MVTVCEKNSCTGCMVCKSVCPKNAITIQDDLYAYNAYIDEQKCTGCNACHKVCQINSQIEKSYPLKWKQGWSLDEEIVKVGSSGGMATALALAFIQKGGYVYSCVFKNGEFIFEGTNEASEISKFSGSKYVKSNPAGIYKEILEKLCLGEKVLFIGLPCQVAALKSYINTGYQINLYTIDLICHGTPSPRLLEAYLIQKKIRLCDIKDLKFRIKSNYQLFEGCNGIERKGICDRYSIAFLNSLTHTENCYNCRYADIKRVSDITLGDSWGSELPDEYHKKGISLVLCQSTRGIELLENASAQLEDVSLEKAISCNHQLQKPSIAPKSRKDFFKVLEKKKDFSGAVFRALPKQCIKQNLKKMLLICKLIRGGE